MARSLASGPVWRGEPPRRVSEDVAAEVLVADQVPEARPDHLGVDRHGLAGELVGAEGDVLEDLLEDGEEAARADVSSC